MWFRNRILLGLKKLDKLQQHFHETDYQPYMSQEMLVHILGGTFECTCGRIGSCILGGTAHVARQASACSLKVGHSTVHVGK